MVALKYRTLNGTTDQLASDFGTLASQSMNTGTIAICMRLVSDNGFDGRMITGSGDAPVSLFHFGTGSNNAVMYSPGGGSFADDGPAMDPSHGFVIIVMAKNSASPVEWSYYRFNTDTWTHTTSATTSSSTGSWPAAADASTRFIHGLSLNADVVCAGVWAGTKLTTGQRETLAVDFASWIALAPDELFRYEVADPANSVVGTCEQWIFGSSDYGEATEDSPLLDEATPPVDPESSPSGFCGHGFGSGCGCAVSSRSPIGSEIYQTWPDIHFLGSGTEADPWTPVLDEDWVNAVADIITGVTDWTPFPFDVGNVWEDYGSGYQVAEYRKIGDLVQLRGVITRYSIVPNLIGALPVGFRPPEAIVRTGDVNDRAHVRLDIYANGDIEVILNGTEAGTGYLTFGFIEFSTVA